MVSFGDQAGKGILDRAVQVRTPHHSTVYKPMLVSAGFSGVFGAENKPLNFHHVGFFGHRYHPLVGLFAQHVEQPRAVVFGFQVKFFSSVVGKSKGYVGMCQSQAHKGFHNGFPFDGVGF